MVKNHSSNLYWIVYSVALSFFLVSNPVLAGVGGLVSATNFLSDLRVWAYGFVGVVAVCHICWKVFQAYTEMDTWAGVLKSLMYAAIAGGCVIAAETCYRIFTN
ncbi:hypothetical protein CBG25_05585 [Arsenophonus sp. ENCA]|uniref:hypothetical protein n=1 Tax=Arsenophonus sp. ENCA TaxID=1987579 RepID=UPI000BC36BFE|nr:hypothetical protein [Arsenophonus sp. ENCA]PAV06574.1 hypothetical protein CBG25_05585 [Arsenophonus sp. ENCA]